MRNIVADGWCYRNPFHPAPAQQVVNAIYDQVGWGQYCAKHAARGVQHYQRSPENIPAEWKGKTGRMWGYRGEWPVEARVKLHLEGKEGDGGWYAYRRLVRSYGLSQARLANDRAAVLYARGMLKSNDRKLAEVRGISAWAPRHIVEQLLENVDARGFAIRPGQ